MRYFNNCKTLDEIKALYKQLAKQYHPDCGGDTATMQAINTEYAYASARSIKGENLSNEETDEKIKLSEEYRAVLEQLISLPNIIIELVGNWIWVTGNTFPVKDRLKSAGLFFASKKVAWYYRAEEYKTKGGKKTLEEIRRKYGSEKIQSDSKSKELQ
ncbi:MAG TPA: hypothetical protein VHA52_13915 [Candidatus Babeliaceae bacterium]|nr:hypothetical protein [Candidatus Babeliaceae bacterium]